MVHTAVSHICAALSALVENTSYWDLKLESHWVFLLWCGRMWEFTVKQTRNFLVLESKGSVMLFLASPWGGLLAGDESESLYLNIFPHKIRSMRNLEQKHWHFLLTSEGKKQTSGYPLSWKATHGASSFFSHLWPYAPWNCKCIWQILIRSRHVKGTCMFLEASVPQTIFPSERSGSHITLLI